MWAPLAADIEPITASCDFWPLGPMDRLFMADLSVGLLTYWVQLFPILNPITFRSNDHDVNVF